MQRIQSINRTRLSELARPCSPAVAVGRFVGQIRPERLAQVKAPMRSTIVRFRTDDDEVEVEAPAKTAVSSTVTLRPWKMNIPTEIGLAVCFPALSLLGAAAYSQVRFEFYLHEFLFNWLLASWSSCNSFLSNDTAQAIALDPVTRVLAIAAPPLFLHCIFPALDAIIGPKVPLPSPVSPRRFACFRRLGTFPHGPGHPPLSHPCVGHLLGP